MCDDCGRIGIAGKEVHGFFEFAHDRWDKEKEVYLLREQNERWDEQEDDEDDATEQNGCGKNDFLICATCEKSFTKAGGQNLTVIAMPLIVYESEKLKLRGHEVSIGVHAVI